MDNIKRIDDEIYEMGQNLLSIIKVKADLLNPEVIIASEKLDSILDNYNSLIRLV